MLGPLFLQVVFADIPTCKNSFKGVSFLGGVTLGVGPGEGCDRGRSNKQQHRAIRMLCSHTRCIYSHTYTHTQTLSSVHSAHSLQIPGDCVLFAAVREPLSICGRWDVCVFLTQERILLHLWHVAESDWMAHDQRQPITRSNLRLWKVDMKKLFDKSELLRRFFKCN